jgi:hypothetical protein
MNSPIFRASGRCAAFGVFLYSAFNIHAATFVWDGTIGNWETPQKWTNGPGGFPGNNQNNPDIVQVGSGSVTVSQAITHNNLTVQLSGGSLVLNANFQPGKAIQVSGGILDVTASQSNAAVNATGGTITGTGMVGGNGAVTFGSSSTHAPGGVGVVGTQPIGQNSVYNTGSIFTWDISGATAFDQVSQTSAQVNGGAVVVNVLAGINFSDTFWNTNRAFQVANFQNGGWFTSLSLLGATMGGNFVLGNPDNNNQVTKNYIYWDTNAPDSFSAVPEVGNALAGLLLGAGLLRRRRSVK